MDDSFKLRADKIFGSLSASLSTSLKPQSSPWSVAAQEVERRQWRRSTDAPDRDNTPSAASFDGEFGIGASIGMDPTLDFEDEEDEFDKVATGAESDDDDRLFMDNVTHHGSFLNSHNVLLGGKKDLRANHLAARHRMKEDDAEAENPNFIAPMGSAVPVKEWSVKSHEEGGQPKPILKRKDNSSGEKSRKRVRFDPAFVNQGESEEGEEQSGGVENLVKANGSGSNGFRVPDYLVNPDKYTCYSFDSTSEVDEVGNSNAYTTQAESSRSEMEEDLVHVHFVPKKKSGDGQAVHGDNQSLNQKGSPVVIAAAEESEHSVVEEDDTESNTADLSDCLQKGGRKFRTKSMSDDESDS